MDGFGRVAAWATEGGCSGRDVLVLQRARAYSLDRLAQISREELRALGGSDKLEKHLDALQCATTAIVPRSRSPGLGRSDLPVVQPRGSRGSRAAAYCALATERGRAAALKEVDENRFARSGKGPREAQWNTWCAACATWGIPPVPLTRDTVRKVAAWLRTGGYRSPGQYFSRAKEEHRREVGDDPSGDVLAAIREYTRSVTRGRGPGQLKEAANIQELGQEPRFQASWARGEQSVCLVVLGAWWMVREIEAAAAQVGDVHIDDAHQKVTWTLPVSKTDPEAGMKGGEGGEEVGV